MQSTKTLAVKTGIAVASIAATLTTSLASYALTLSEFKLAGTQTDRITSAHTINAYSSLDRQYLLLAEGKKRHYLLNLGSACHRLAWAENINISQSDDTIHAGYDYVSVNGARCAIGEIRQISREEMQAIVWSHKV